MVKLKQLRGIAHNLADSFISASNHNYITELGYFPEGGDIEIDLLKKKISPVRFDTDHGEKAVKKYKQWFLSEIKEKEIPLKYIEKVLIKIGFNKGEVKKGSYISYICKAEIKANGKEYTAKVSSSWY